MKALNEIPDAWRMAMQREKEAGEFYARMAQAATDEGTRSLFEMLVEQEKRHYAILEAEYRRLFEPDLELARERLPITWYEWDEESFELADTLDLPVLLYITAPWCEPCHLMEDSTLADPEVVQILNDHWIGPDNAYVCGNEITIADYLGVAFLTLGEIIRNDFSVYPNVARWLANMKKLKSWDSVNEVLYGFADSVKEQPFDSL